MRKQQLLKFQNRAAILNTVRQHGIISRVEVSRLTGLSVGAVTGLTRELIQDGLIYEKQEGDSRGGRPPILLSLQPGGAYVVGIKLSADQLTFALTNLDADVVDRLVLSGLSADPETVAGRVAEGLRSLMETSGVEPGRLLGVGIGMAGILDADHGHCHLSPILGWQDVPFAEMIESRVHLPVYLDNDVNTLTLMERLYGAGVGIDHFLTITVGRGVGLGIVANGQIYRGMGGAGEFGHTLIDPQGEICDCGKRGCLETFVSDPWLLRRAHHLLPAIQTVDDLNGAAENGQAEMIEILRGAGEVLGKGIAMLVNILHPQLIIFSGEGMRYGDKLLDSVRESLSLYAMPALMSELRLHVEPLGDDAWARGAASLVLQELFRTSHPRIGSL